MRLNPSWLLSMWGPGVDWPFVQNVWFWVMAAFKFCVWLMILAVHLYPKKGKVDEALKTLAGFAVGKPVLIEETFPLKRKPHEERKPEDYIKDRGWEP